MLMMHTPSAAEGHCSPVHSSPIATLENEAIPTPDEVSRRILEVRSSWDVRERMARRRVAQNRFESLVVALMDGHAA